MDKELKEMFEKLHKAHAEFRASNDERYDKIKKGVESIDTLLTAKIDTQNAEVGQLTARILEMQEQLRQKENAQARLLPAGSPEAEQRDRKFTAQFLSLTQQRKIDHPDEVTAADVKIYRDYAKAFSAWLRQGEAIKPEYRAALQTGSLPDGGQFVTPDTSGRIVEFIRETSPMREVADVQPIGVDKLEGTYDLDEADSGWVGETASRPETTTPKVGAWSIEVHEQYANPKASQKQLDDSNFDVEGWLARKVANKMSRRENTAFCLGVGVSTPRGFTTYSSGVPTAAAFEVIERIKSGVDGGFLTPSATVNPADKFLDMVTALKVPLRAGALWAMNSITLAKVRQLRDIEGKYLLIPDFSNGPSGTILGFGVKEFQDMANYSVTDALAIAFANWKEAYTILDHTVGTRVLRDPFTAKPWVHFYTTKRVGGKVLNFEAIKLMQMGD